MAKRFRIATRRTALRSAFLVAASFMVPALMPSWASAGPAAPATHAYPQLFGTREIESKNLATFPKWLGVVERYGEERSGENGPCPANTMVSCRLPEWSAFLGTLRGEDSLAQLQNVNHYVNNHPYVLDPVNYHVPDYWATPKQFLDIDGDCEDYAIAKYYSLRELGFDKDEMRVVVLQDLNLQLPHAILVVYLDAKAYVLDNQIPEVVSAEIIHHYRPYYSINEDHWWLHRPQ
ncbi:MAG: transglutaminase-like cysteine peptidase [Alphaproteobacteria bacterium]